jgi:hypothetical protein
MPANQYSDSLLMDALRGSLSNLESLGRGAAVVPIGLLGDINALAREYVTPRLPQSVQGLLQAAPAAPTTEQILSNIPRVSQPRMETSGMEQLGAAMNPRGPVDLARGAGRLAGSQINRAMMGEGGLLAPITPQPMRIVPKGYTSVTPEVEQQMAREAAEKAGQSLDPYTRSLQQGYEHGWYHGSTGDITQFRKDLLGEATGAESAKKGFFFARDPQNPPASMMQKSSDEKSVELLRKLGIPEEEIAKLNTISMAGHGAETASGYAQIGGSRKYKEAMRSANAAEKKGNWDEYEKQMALAEDIAIGDQRYLQDLTAKYGDVRDQMLSDINSAIYSKQLPQKDAELLDAKVKELMPYGWYNSYSNPQLDGLKKEIANLAGEDASKAIKSIEQFQSVKNERALAEKTQEGSNVMPVALRYKNPLVYDFAGNTYRDQTYSDLVDQAMKQGNDAVILKNTFDPAAGPSKLIDVGVVFEPNQIRSKFAAFNPENMKSGNVLAGALPFSLLADEENRKQLESYGLLAP